MLEIIAEKEIYDYNYKYLSDKTKYIIPNDIDKKLKKEIIFYAEKSFKLLNCKDIARVDFRINKRALDNKVYLLEINTQPGLTENSLFPRIAQNSGIAFSDLIERIVNNAGLVK